MSEHDDGSGDTLTMKRGRPEDKEHELSVAVAALSDATKSLTATSNQLAELAQGMAARMPAADQGTGGAAFEVRAVPLVTINAWEDDPFSEAIATTNPPVATPSSRPVPANTNARLQTQIVEPAPAAARYNPGTAEFRYWTTAEALARGINFWSPLLPAGTTWSASNPMNVRLVAGEDLNANYSRPHGLRFYHKIVKNIEFFSCESPDVACHELGHAVLDAVRPQLFNAASIEAAAFHESFGDMAAILNALQLQSLRAKVLAETQGHLSQSSRLSRLAEQLGWAIRQVAPTAVDADCLRNAANRFAYQRPDTLPPSAPANRLSSEVHSFSRVFTGAFLDALARMVGNTPTHAVLLTVSHDMGQLLVDAVRAAAITPAYFSQVAAAIIQADQGRNGGRYRAALTSAFVGRGILSVAAALELPNAPAPAPVTPPLRMAREPNAGAAVVYQYADMATDDAFRKGYGETPDLPLVLVPLNGGMNISVHAPEEQPRFAVAPAMLGGQPRDIPSGDQAAAHFVEDLIQQGRIDLKTAGAALADLDQGNPLRKTHVLVRGSGDTMVLKRNHFDCGCCQPTGALRLIA